MALACVLGARRHVTHGSKVRLSSAQQLAVIACAAVLLERLLALTLPTTWEWDAITRALQAYALASDGPKEWFTSAPRVVWLPGMQAVQATAIAITGADPLVVGEWLSALATGATAAYTVGLARLAGAPTERRWVAAALLATSGQALAYFSQGMTEAFSVAAFVALIYHLLTALRTGRRRHAGAAAVAWLLYASTRWEGILLLGVLPVLLLSALGPTWRAAFARTWRLQLAMVTPAALFAALFLAYSRWIDGAAFGAVSAVSTHATETRWFKGAVLSDFGFMLIALLVTQGVLWVAAIPAALRPSKVASAHGESESSDAQEAATRLLFGRLVVFQAVWFWCFLMLGLIYPSYRYLLVSLPLSAALVVSASWSARTWRTVVLLSACVGAGVFGYHRYKHDEYMSGDPAHYEARLNGGRWVRVRP